MTTALQDFVGLREEPVINVVNPFRKTASEIYVMIAPKGIISLIGALPVQDTGFMRGDLFPNSRKKAKVIWHRPSEEYSMTE